MSSDRTFNLNLGSLGRVEAHEADLEDIDLDQEILISNGERITESRAREIAREISRLNGLKGGRPPLPEEERASVQKGVRLTPKEADQLASIAAQKGLKESQIIREALRHYFSAA